MIFQQLIERAVELVDADRQNSAARYGPVWESLFRPSFSLVWRRHSGWTASADRILVKVLLDASGSASCSSGSRHHAATLALRPTAPIFGGRFRSDWGAFIGQPILVLITVRDGWTASAEFLGHDQYSLEISSQPVSFADVPARFFESVVLVARRSPGGIKGFTA